MCWVRARLRRLIAGGPLVVVVVELAGGPLVVVVVGRGWRWWFQVVWCASGAPGGVLGGVAGGRRRVSDLFPFMMLSSQRGAGGPLVVVVCWVVWPMVAERVVTDAADVATYVLVVPRRCVRHCGQQCAGPMWCHVTSSSLLEQERPPCSREVPHLTHFPPPRLLMRCI